MAQPAETVPLMMSHDMDALIKKEDIAAMTLQPLPGHSSALQPHNLIQAFLPLTGHPHQSFVTYPTQNYFGYGSAGQPMLSHFVVNDAEAQYFRAGYRFVDLANSAGTASQGLAPATGLSIGTAHPLLLPQLHNQSMPLGYQAPTGYSTMFPPSPISPVSSPESSSPREPSTPKKSPGGQKRAAALSTEICKALLGKSSEFDGEVLSLKLEGNTPAERRTWFHQNVVDAGLYMVSFPVNLTRRAIVSFEKSDKEVKYHATTWSKRAGQGAEAPYVYMRCCPVSATCLARKYVVLFPAHADEGHYKNSSYKAMSVFIPGPEQHECSKNPAFTGQDVHPDVQARFETHATMGLAVE